MTDKTRIVRVFSDGAARGNPGPAGAGAVIEDEGGRVIAEISEFLGEKTNNAAEYIALILALEKASTLGECKVEVRLDSQLLVEQIRGHFKVKSAVLKPFFVKAKELLATFACADVAHVYREENARADELANQAIDAHLAGKKSEATSLDIPGQESLF
ncbi:MAG: ribonuclease HI family protein [Actinobacteria bacterium]|nr:ribonuclease HI family protein [Actinomycetota bacterium]